MVDVALKLKSVTFPQGEEIVRAGALSTRLYIVERGVVGGKGRVFTSGKTFGEEVLNGGGAHGVHRAPMTYCDVFALEGREIAEIASAFPVMQTRLRVAGCRGMMKDAMVAVEHAWRQVLRGHRRAPEVPETLHEDASLEDVAVKRRADLIFKFAVSLSDGARGQAEAPGGPGRVRRPSRAEPRAAGAERRGTGTETRIGGTRRRSSPRWRACRARWRGRSWRSRRGWGRAVESTTLVRIHQDTDSEAFTNAITKRAFYASTFGPVFVLARGLISFLGTPDATSDTSD